VLKKRLRIELDKKDHLHRDEINKKDEKHRKDIEDLDSLCYKYLEQKEMNKAEFR
jgi:hypothetical protein